MVIHLIKCHVQFAIGGQGSNGGIWLNMLDPTSHHLTGNLVRGHQQGNFATFLKLHMLA